MTQTTLQDLAWAIGFAVLTAVSPFMPRDPTLATIGSALIGALAFGFLTRRRRGRPAQAAPSIQLSVPASVWMCTLLFAVVAAPTAQWMFRRWTGSIWENGHSIFVPLIILYFAHRILLRPDGRLPGEERGREESSAWGVPFMLVGLGAVVLDIPVQSRYLASIGLLVCIPGLSLLLLGARRTRKLLFPLALCIFLLPAPFAFGDQFLLRDATAVGTEFVLRTLGHPVARELTVLMLPSFSIDISDACSGFSALYASAFVAAVLAVHAQSKWRGALILLSVWPIALLANILRATGLVELIEIYGREILATRVHPGSGAATFVFALVALFVLAGRRTIRAVLS